ncbi:hypothetical protein [Ochrobactrum sp. Marseille-Q0166]|uniref:hypothetical protein n=1 Tax=Ochrobactrum sp. Marseille-Q0166 TaxID=2761105 RepID=UPI001655E8FB|nr:hypothetical protein [Ochrobactrum sp. Marseille-Q0166]MBC8719574.1 hypothetical protein [Ochrobactrum sp. Marseille-Q0166]
MKKPLRNVVVEYKNKRSRKASVSIWGELDLNTIIRDVETSMQQSSTNVRAGSDAAEAFVNVVEDTASGELSPIASPERLEIVQAEPAASAAVAVKFKKPVTTSDAVQKPQVAEDVVGRQNRRPVRRKAQATLSPQHEAATFPTRDADIINELSALEIENASLKRELIVWLVSENRHLAVMLKQVEKRTGQKK